MQRLKQREKERKGERERHREQSIEESENGREDLDVGSRWPGQVWLCPLFFM